MLKDKNLRLIFFFTIIYLFSNSVSSTSFDINAPTNVPQTLNANENGRVRNGGSVIVNGAPAVNLSATAVNNIITLDPGNAPGARARLQATAGGQGIFATAGARAPLTINNGGEIFGGTGPSIDLRNLGSGTPSNVVLNVNFTTPGDGNFERDMIFPATGGTLNFFPGTYNPGSAPAPIADTSFDGSGALAGVPTGILNVYGTLNLSSTRTNNINNWANFNVLGGGITSLSGNSFNNVTTTTIFNGGTMNVLGGSNIPLSNGQIIVNTGGQFDINANTAVGSVTNVLPPINTAGNTTITDAGLAANNAINVGRISASQGSNTTLVYPNPFVGNPVFTIGDIVIDGGGTGATLTLLDSGGVPNSHFLINSINLTNRSTFHVQNGFRVATNTLNASQSTILVDTNPAPITSNITLSNTSTLNVVTPLTVVGPGNVITLNSNSDLELNNNIVVSGNSLTLNSSNMNVIGGVARTVQAQVTLNAGSNINLNNDLTILGAGNNLTLNSSTMNVNGAPRTVTSQVNLNSGSTLTVASQLSISGAGNGLLNQGSTVNLNNNLNFNAGTTGFTNNGNLIPTPLSTRTIFGNYTENAASNTQFALVSTSNFTKINVDHFALGGGAASTLTINGGNIQVNLPSGPGQINDGDVFPILNAVNGSTLVQTAQPTVSVPQSAILTFTSATTLGPNGNFRLIAHRQPVAQAGMTPQFAQLGGVLDQSNAALLPLVNALVAIPTSQGLAEALEELIPEGNGGSIMASFQHMDYVLNKISNKRNAVPVPEELLLYGPTGYAGGDDADGRGTHGPFIFGANLNQKRLADIKGYNAWMGGVGILGDVPLNPYSKIGAALSTSIATKIDSSQAKNKVQFATYQGTIYGSVDWWLLFLEAYIGYAQHDYRQKRNVVFLNETESSHFRGHQYAGRFKGGLTVPVRNSIEVTPYVEYRYNHLRQSAYNEQGGIAALKVPARQVVSAQGGGGFRLTNIGEMDGFYPEIHFLYLRQIKGPSFQNVGQFELGGGSFIIGTKNPYKDARIIGASVTYLVTENFIFQGAYDLESRTKFIGHTLSFKFRWMF